MSNSQSPRDGEIKHITPIAVIVSVGEFVDVPRQVPKADFVILADDPAL
jgi:hypothetical protein